MKEISKLNQDDISNLLDYLGLKKEDFLDQHIKNLLIEKWVEIVGEGYSKYTYPFQIKQNKLVILISHDSFRMELEFKKKFILENIKKLINNSCITQLVYRQGIIPNKQKEKFQSFKKTYTTNSELYKLIPEEENNITKQKLKELIDSFPKT